MKARSIPKSVQEALENGYNFDPDAGESWVDSGGLFGTQFRVGELSLTSPVQNLPDLVLPYRTKLVFGAPRLDQPREMTKAK